LSPAKATPDRIRAVLAHFAPTAAAQSDLSVDVRIVDGGVRADVSLFVQAPRQRVWDVITDYERAPEFMRDL
jgi:carbon monoxide dehydrogenase subunit G